MNAISDQAFRSKLEVLLGERKGAEQNRAVRLKEIGAILRNTTGLVGTIDPAIIKPIVDKVVDDALDGWTPPSIDPILARLDQAEQDAEQAKQDALNALAQAEAANAHTDAQVALVAQDIANLNAQAAQIASDLQDGLNAANAYTDTGLAAYSVTIEGQFSSFAGQIEQLTAALTSANLVGNGLFALGATGWTLTDAAVLARADLTGLGAAAPQPNLVELAAASAASISTELNAFTVTGNDRIQFRFSAAASAVRTLTVTLAWKDAGGNPLGTPATETLTLSPANTWKVYSKQVDPPDDAVGATLTIAKMSGGAAAFITAIEASTVNIALEARVTQIEATQITEDDVVSIIATEVDSRFDDAHAAISQEAMTRASETEALSLVQNRLSATLDKDVGGVIADPHLASEGWTRWTGQGSLVLTENQKYEIGRTWDFTVTATQQDGMAIIGSPETIWPGQTNAGGYVVEVDYTLVSGSLGGARVLLDWNTSAGEFRVTKNLSDMTPGTGLPGRTRTARAVFVRPSNFTGTFSSHDLYIMVNYGTDMAAKRIRFHRVKVRVATEEEMGRGQVMAEVQAHLDTNYFTKADTNKAIAEFDMELYAELGGAWAQVKQSATTLATLDGTVARFSNIATTADGKVAAGIEAVAFDGTGGATGSLVKLIGDNVVAPGTLSTNKLVVGLGGNLVMDPSFDDGFEANWIGDGTISAADRLTRLRGPGASWSHPGRATMQLHQRTGYGDGTRYVQVYQRPSADGAGTRYPGVPVTGNKWYIASAYFRTLSCEAQLYIYWYDAEGNRVGSTPSSARKQYTIGANDKPDAWDRVHVKAQAPADAAYCSISFIKRDTLSGAVDSNLFVWKPQLELVHEKAEEPKAWSPGGTTYINGGRLFSKTVAARHMDTESLGVAGLAIFNGTLKSDNFNEAAGTGWRITKSGVMNMPHASVNTLEIAGNAVIVPVSVEADTPLQMNTEGAWMNALVLWVNRAGAPTSLDMTAQIDGFNEAAVGFRLLRNGNLVGGPWVNITGSLGAQASTAIDFYDDNLGTGATQYILQTCRVNSGKYNNTPRVLLRTLRAMHIKR